MAFSVVIPARYASTRLPGKPLQKIAGIPMIQHVYERAVSSGAADVIIATDDQRVEQAAQQFGAQVCMTSAEHCSGTDRLAEVVDKLNFSADHIVVNLQGDEPLMPPGLIHQVADDLSQNRTASVTSLCEPISHASDLFDTHKVKVVMDKDGYALYFSRAVIPWDRDAFSTSTEILPPGRDHYRHIGLYAYRAGFIKEYVQWPACELEQMESLEQLRVLWQGHRIHLTVASEHPGHGVDTEKDLQLVEKILAQSRND